MKYEKVTVFSNGIPYLTTPDFLRVPGLAAGFSTRRGGVSQGHCAAFNFGFSRGDDPHHVAQNYRLFAQALGADVKGVSAVRQVHSALEAGMQADNITCLGECCYEHPDRYFSHRVHGEQRGVLMALIGLRAEEV